MSISVDGFVAGPNGELDWMFVTRSEASTQWIVDLLWQASLHAMGHNSYRNMAAYWPTSTDPVATPMNTIPKVVFSRSGTVSPPAIESTSADPAVLEGWVHPLVAGKDLAADIQRLKSEDGGPILAHGGASFASSLVAAHLVDVFHLVVHPVALGRGLPIFAELENPLHLKLEEAKEFKSGVAIKTYRPRY
jgi:dihydrofolate reductase